MSDKRTQRMIANLDAQLTLAMGPVEAEQRRRRAIYEAQEAARLKAAEAARPWWQKIWNWIGSK